MACCYYCWYLRWTVRKRLMRGEECKMCIRDRGRILRFLASFFAMTLPGLYLAVCNFHTQILPTKLLLSFAAARQGVPFPGVVEVLLMELSFELLREAGVRLPGAMGNTIGIVGGLIIGQAAVEANLVSPIVVIVVAFTALCSFAVPNEEFATAFRILKFFFIAMCAVSYTHLDVYKRQILSSAITGPIATCVFHLQMNGAAVASGMGTCGLVGQIGIYTGWINDIASGAKAAITPMDWIGMLLVCFILPGVLTWAFGLFFRKIGWIKENDLKLDL